MFNPKYSVLRSISNRLAGKVEGKSLDLLADAMQDPARMADLIDRVTPQQRTLILQALVDEKLLPPSVMLSSFLTAKEVE